MSEVKNLIKTVVCSIVDNTEGILIEEEDIGTGVLFIITVSAGDVGKLIGTKGRVAEALRIVAKAAGAKIGKRVLVNVMNTPLEDG